MADVPDWEKKYWEKRAQQAPHQQRPVPPAPPAVRDVEINAADIMSQRAMAGMTVAPRHGQHPGVVYLREGATYYRQIHNPDGFGTTMPLVRSMGPLAQVGGKTFDIKGDMRAYCIDNLPSVDLSRVNENPERMLVLVRVSAPFVGDILVPRAAIIETSPTQGSKQLLRG